MALSPQSEARIEVALAAARRYDGSRDLGDLAAFLITLRQMTLTELAVYNRRRVAMAR